jgi:hypothetical protein
MRTHEIDVTNLIPVKERECFKATLEQKDNRFILKTVVGDLVELKNEQMKDPKYFEELALSRMTGEQISNELNYEEREAYELLMSGD